MVVDFAKRMEMAVVNKFFRMMQKNQVTYKSVVGAHRWTTFWVIRRSFQMTGQLQLM